MIIIIIHAPLDIATALITDSVKYEENLRKYKSDRKKYLYWDKVPPETQKTWSDKIYKSKEIDLGKTIT